MLWFISVTVTQGSHDVDEIYEFTPSVDQFRLFAEYCPEVCEEIGVPAITTGTDLPDGWEKRNGWDHEPELLKLWGRSEYSDNDGLYYHYTPSEEKSPADTTEESYSQLEHPCRWD